MRKILMIAAVSVGMLLGGCGQTLQNFKGFNSLDEFVVAVKQGVISACKFDTDTQVIRSIIRAGPVDFSGLVILLCDAAAAAWPPPVQLAGKRGAPAKVCGGTIRGVKVCGKWVVT